MPGKSTNIKKKSKVSGSAGAGELLVAAIVYTGKFRDLITGGNRNICSLLEAIGCAIELINGLELLGCCNQERSSAVPVPPSKSATTWYLLPSSSFAA